MLWLLFLVASTAATSSENFLKKIKVSLDDLLPEVVTVNPRDEQLFFRRETLFVTSKLDDKDDEKYLSALRLLAEDRMTGIDRRDERMLQLHAAALHGHKGAKIVMGFDNLLNEETIFDDYLETKKNFETMSREGVADAQMGLAYMYTTGTGAKRDQAKAILYYTFAAKGGNPFAQMVMGYRHSYGIGVEKSCDKAVEYYRHAAASVSHNTRFASPPPEPRIRLTDEVDPDMPTKNLALYTPNELEYFKTLSDQGDSEMATSLGYMYLTGKRGIRQDYRLATRYFELAEREGDSAARTYLATMYLEGTPSTRANNVTAFTKFFKAAKDDETTALCGLGHMYLFGLGVEPDREKAIKLFLRAADEGNPIAHLYLGCSFETSSLEEKYKSALEHYQVAAQGGQVIAVHNLGMMYYMGRGVTKSCETATRLFRQVAEVGEWSRLFVEAAEAKQNDDVVKAALIYRFLSEMGYDTAQLNYAHLLDTRLQINGTRARKEASFWWKRAADQNSVYARNKLGDYYYQEGNLTRAVEQYQYAAENFKSPRAFFNLALMHESGDGVTKDLNMAETYYNLAQYYNPAAFYPVQLALFKLQCIRWLKVYHFFNTYCPHWDLCVLGGMIGGVLFGIRILQQ